MTLREIWELQIPDGLLDELVPRIPPLDKTTDRGEYLRFALCFPLLSDDERSVIFAAISLARAVRLGVNAPVEKLPEVARIEIDRETRSSEQGYMECREIVEQLWARGRLTAAQKELIDAELKIEFRHHQ